MKVPRLEPIAPRVWLLRGGLTRLMNVYLIEDDDGVVVFDAGEKGMASAIAAAAARLGGINRVVLGHGDTDHRGSAPELSKVAPVLCHPDAVGQAEGSGGRDYWHMERLPTRDPPAAPLHAPLRLGRRAGEDLRHRRRRGADRGLRGGRARRPRARADRALARVRRRRAGQRHRLPDDDDRPADAPPTSRTRPTTWTRRPRARASAGWRRCGRGSSPSATSAR